MKLEKINERTEVRQHNFLTEARYEMTACEMDILFCLLNEIREDESRNFYQLKVKEIELLTGRQWNYQQCRESTFRLAERVFEVINENGNLLQFSLVSTAEYKMGEGIIELEVSPKVIPYLYELKKNYTAFRLLASLRFTSKYAKRFYLYCSRWKDVGSFTTTIDELKIKLKLKDPKRKKEKYVQVRQFVDKALEVAVQEINEVSELMVQYTLIKEGRKYTKVRFNIERKKDVAEEALVDERQLRAHALLKEMGITRPDYVKAVLSSEDKMKALFKWNYERKQGKLGKLENPSGHLLKVLGLV
jgi:plasmid replication initiation protein